MTKYRAQIKFDEKVYKQIKWFTEEFDKEIGAVGIGEVKDGEIFVKKLVFPKQIVNGAHVHFKPEDWSDIIKECTMEEIENICFYWHKHPDNMPGASSGDETDTFDVFMDPDSGREIFAFMQTANSNDGIKHEARIEMRKPIWCSITDVEIYTASDEEIEVECKKIIEDKVTMGYAGASDQTGVSTLSNIQTTLTPGNTTGVKLLNTTNPVEVFDAFIENGAVKVCYNADFDSDVLDILEQKDIKKMFKKQSLSMEKDSVWIRTIQPKKKMLTKLLEAIHDAAIAREEEILAEWDAYNAIAPENMTDLEQQVADNLLAAAHNIEPGRIEQSLTGLDYYDWR